MFWEKKLRLSCIVSVAMCAIGPLAAQGQQSMADMNAPGMFLMGLASGTSANPASYPMLNSLFHNKGGGNFEEVAFDANVALREDGTYISGMGVDFRDLDNDGYPDICLAALDNEPLAAGDARRASQGPRGAR